MSSKILNGDMKYDKIVFSLQKYSKYHLKESFMINIIKSQSISYFRRRTTIYF